MTELLIILALAASGLTWTLGGYLSAWRKRESNPDWNGFEVKKLGADVLLGLILGLGAYILGSYNGNLTDITSLQTFIASVAGGFGLVAAVDKFIIGGLFNK